MNSPPEPSLADGATRPTAIMSASWIVSASCMIALLHFGRELLEPLTLAAVLSLAMAPLVHRLRNLGLGRTAATLVAVTLAGVAVAAIGVVLALQVAGVAADLPRYKQGLQAKIDQMRAQVQAPFEIWANSLRTAPATPTGLATPPLNQEPLSAGNRQAVLVRIQEPELTSDKVLTRLLSALSGPAGEGFVVFVLLVFILLEHESLRERLIRLAGESDVTRTVQALADAGDGVSRFFLSQLAVNLAFAGVTGAVLWFIGLPHALLWASLAGLLRFVPYIGLPAAGAAIAIFAAAVDPGWSLLFSCLAWLTTLELLVANLIEPRLYGHSTGLAPLAVIVAALFWGNLWGLVGLLLSTPLTLCIVVAGRHVAALTPLAILLGDSPGLSQGQRFYQRALSVEFGDILQDARAYLRQHRFATYCDHVLLPGLALAEADYRAGRIGEKQQVHLGTAIGKLLASVAEGGLKSPQHRHRPSVGLAGMGAYLRRMRKARLGRWQGTLDVPPRSVVLCAGFATQRDELLTELLVESLRDAGIDARSALVGQLLEAPATENLALVATLFLAYPADGELQDWQAVCRKLRSCVPHAMLITIRPPLTTFVPDEALVKDDVDLLLHSVAEGVALVAQVRGGEAGGAS